MFPQKVHTNQFSSRIDWEKFSPSRRTYLHPRTHTTHQCIRHRRINGEPWRDHGTHETNIIPKRQSWIGPMNAQLSFVPFGSEWRTEDEELTITERGICFPHTRTLLSSLSRAFLQVKAKRNIDQSRRGGDGWMQQKDVVERWKCSEINQPMASTQRAAAAGLGLRCGAPV